MKNVKAGILKETKTPPDKRAALAPVQAAAFKKKFPDVELVVQSSESRAFSDAEYREAGIEVRKDISDCDLFLGVKECKIDSLIEGKTYFFFSHTAKRQEYNRPLLQALLKKKIRMIDHEYLTDKQGRRLVAFGHWAGLVGAYNALLAYGIRSGAYKLKRAKDCKDTKEMKEQLKTVSLPPVKIVITGGGRVAKGALETLKPLNLKEVSPQDFLKNEYNEAVYTRLDPNNYVKRKDGSAFDLQDFFDNPPKYESSFPPYTQTADMFIACHFWDENSPVFFTRQDIEDENFRLKVIADVSCDIALPIPTTIRASEIAAPFYGYNPKTHTEGKPFEDGNITVMAVDNLPGEVPRDASEDFGAGLNESVFPSLFGDDTNGIIKRAVITENGKLTENFAYLKDFAEGKE